MHLPFTKAARRQKLLAEPFPEPWLEILQCNVFFYRLLSGPEQAKLRDSLRIFVAEKFWEGCRGQEITDEVKVTIAAGASLLTLGFEDYHFEEVKTVLVYPGGFFAEIDPEEGEGVDALGQAMRGGPVAVSWWNARWDSRRLGVENVVLHEFAHVLGYRFNPHEGIPEPDDEPFRDWRRLVLREFRQLREDVDAGVDTLLDPQGTENLAEFFAVATECFFLQAPALKEEHEELYAALAGWFRQDPITRREPTEAEWTEMDRTEQEYDEHLVRECNATLGVYSDHSEALLQRATALHRLGRHAEAVADYDLLLRNRPNDAEVYGDRGAAYLAMGRLDRAIADCSQALRLDPEFAEAYETRAEAYAARGDAARSEADRAAARRLRDMDAE